MMWFSTTVLDTALQKYRPGRTEPILVGGIAQLKPALRLMMSYRLVIRGGRGRQVLTSYTRWFESVQLKEGENQEVYVAFNPRFERIWLESKKRLPEYMAQKPANSPALLHNEDISDFHRLRDRDLKPPDNRGQRLLSCECKRL
jgi:hypothetical protein